MKKQELFNAINNLAKELGLNHFSYVDSETDVPMAMKDLAAVVWVKNFPENENTKIIREQTELLWYKGALKFEDEN